MALRTKSIPPWLLYGLYLLSVTVLFLYYLFPAEAVKRYVQTRASQLDSALQVTAGQVRPAFPAHMRWSNVSLRYNRQLLFKADKITVAPRLFSFLFGEKGYTIRTDVYGGTVKGRMETASGGLAGRLKLSALKLEGIPGLKSFGQLKPTGKLSCRLDFVPENNTFSAEGNFSITDLTVNLADSLPGMTALSFSTFSGKIGFSANRLAISDGKARGRQADAGLKGTLTLEKPLMESDLALSVTVRPHVELIATLRKNPVFQWASGTAVEKNGLPIDITGTIADPQISLQQSEN